MQHLGSAIDLEDLLLGFLQSSGIHVAEDEPGTASLGVESCGRLSDSCHTGQIRQYVEWVLFGWSTLLEGL
jgi:hypothetical protein